jgi:hypothetical protein
MGSAEMMQARVDHETHMKAVRSSEEGDHPDYFDNEDEPDVIRLSPEQAKTVFSTVEGDED